MRSIEQLRLDADCLESEIGKLISVFITKHGNCDINIDVNTVFQSLPKGEIFVKSGVDIIISI